LFYDGQTFTEFSSPRLITKNTHGTGCTLSAALATYLAQGFPMLEAARRAKAFVTSALRAGLTLGGGPGPTNPGFTISKWEQREKVLTDLDSALQELLRRPLGALIPEIRSNLGYGLPGASNVSDVAAIPGRITQTGDRLMAWSAPTFGASRHIAKVILTTMSYYPDRRSAMNIRFEPNILDACQRLNLKMAQFDRADEPKTIKEQEGSSLEWGTQQALKGTDVAPDGIYDRGDVGKEPVIRILGPTPDHVVNTVIRIHRKMNAATND
jgi:hydroxymethylpyrimidine kinase / phosphomethylpyrimidine kinase / thiamine-phosphate diphosphorylase